MRLSLFTFALALTASAADPIILFNDDGAWNWFQDERAIIDAGKLYIGSVASGATDPDRRGAVELTTFDLSTATATREPLHQPATAAERTLWYNDHSAPALIARPDHQILAVYTTHGRDSRLYYRVPPRDEQVLRTHHGSRLCFPSLCFAGPSLYAFFRGLDNKLMPSWTASPDNGDSWQPPAILLQTPGPKPRVPYAKYASANGVIHIVYTTGHHFDYGNALYHATFKNGHLSTPTVIDQASQSAVFWLSDFHIDPTGAPVIAYTVQADSPRAEDHRYRYARQTTPAHWTTHEIAHAGSRIHTFADGDDCTGLAAIDPQDPNTVVISTNVHPRTGAPLISRVDRQRHWEIFEGHTRDHGANFTWTAITQDSTADNIRPIIPAGRSPKLAVIWLRGAMRSYDDYNLEVVGILRNRPPMP